MSNNNGIYTEDETAVLERIKQTRLNIITDMTKDGVPCKSGDIRVLNEVMTSADKMITDSALIRVKHSEAQSAGAAAEMVAELLKQARRNKQVYQGKGDIPELPKELTPTDIVEGETEIAPMPLSPEDFVAPKFDPSQLEK